MKITFFGTSHGKPEPHRKRSSAMVEIGENRYIIDIGTDITEPLITRAIPFDSLRAIFITHMHTDHTNGLIPFVGLCRDSSYKIADPMIFLPGDIEKTVEAMNAWMLCNGTPITRDYRYMPVSEGALYDDGTLRVTAFRTRHTNESYAYLLEAEGKRVLFSGDLSHLGPTEPFLVSLVQTPLDLAICECAHFEGTDYLPLFEKNEHVRRLYINHYSARRLPSVLALKNALTHMECTLASDDMEIVV